MTEPNQSARARTVADSDVEYNVPHVARVYDYWLGGNDNFEADREAAEFTLRLMPEMLDYARGNRAFMVRAVQFLVSAGVTQFLDVGSGFPTSPNVNEVAQQTAPGARTVYVDYDPMVVSHAQGLMARNSNTDVVKSDLRDVDKVLQESGKLLDFSKPVALMFVACLHHLEDEDDPVGVVARYLPALAPGSWLVLSHLTDEFAPEKMRALYDRAKQDRGTVKARPKEAIARMFNGLEPIDPGLVLVSHWRPAGDQPDPNADRSWAYGGVASVQR